MDISKATRLRRGGIFKYYFIANLLLSLTVKKLKIGKHLAKLRIRLWCLVFLTHSVHALLGVSSAPQVARGRASGP